MCMRRRGRAKKGPKHTISMSPPVRSISVAGVSRPSPATHFSRRATGCRSRSIAVCRRRLHRIHVTANTADDCNDALAGLGIAIDPDSGAILSPTRLTVGFDPAGITDDPCKPATRAGFLGADNQTFRVQITAPGRFIWGADNASPLYRVQAQGFQEPGGGPATLRRIHFL